MEQCIKDIENHVKSMHMGEIKNNKKLLLSSGSTLLNLACSNRYSGAFLPGRYYLIVGDSTSGKTFLSMSCFAEAVQNSNFKHYRLIYDNVEDGCLIDLSKLFNETVAKSVAPPRVDEDDVPYYSSTIEEFYYHLDDAVKRARKDGVPFLYVLDSMDSLSSEFEQDKFDQQKKASRLGKDSTGSMGDGKAKKNSEGLRRALRGLRDTNSILIVISQTRDNLGFGFSSKTRSGGHSLRFYASVEIWTSVSSKIKKTVCGKSRGIGVHIKAEVKKNRITGETHNIGLDIYPTYGIDDIGSNIDYLLSEGWWRKTGLKISAVEFKVALSRDKLIEYVEKRNLQRTLQKIVAKCWKNIAHSCALTNRRKKY